jgi:hypothetical protein
MITALMSAEASWSTDRPRIPILGTIDFVIPDPLQIEVTFYISFINRYSVFSDLKTEELPK